MRFLFLALDVDLSRAAGDATHVRELARSLAALGHSVHVVAERHSSVTSEGGNVRIHDIRPLSTFRTILEASRIARLAGAEVVYERRLTPKVGYAVSVIRRIPLIAEINGLPDEERRILGSRNPRVLGLRRASRRFLLSRAKAIVTVSSVLRNVLLETYKLPADRVAVIPNGVNLELFRPLDKVAARLRLGLPVDQLVVGFSGQLTPWQGVDILLKAIAVLRNSGARAMAFIVGDGPERTRLESLAESLGIVSEVRFGGVVPYESVPEHIATFDIAFAVRPPLLPGSPLKVREYMACGRPIVASSRTAYDFAVVEEAGAGVLVDPARVDQVADAIKAISVDSDAASRMGSAGRAFAERACSWRMTAEKVAEVCSA